MGKLRAWQLLDALRREHLAQPSRDEQPTVLNLTDDRLFPWKLWLCNLGYFTRDLIGTGISAIHLPLHPAPTFIFVTRSDGTNATLSLAHRTHRDGTHSYYTELSEN